MESGIVAPKTGGVQWINLIIRKLEHWKIGITPRLVGTEDLPDNNADERVTKIGANMRGKILDPWVDLLPGTVNNDDPRK